MRPQLGVTFAPADYGSHLAKFPEAAFCRVFSPGDWPTWTDPRVAALLTAGVTPFLSCKGYHPTGLRKLLDTMPPSVPLVYLAQHHEPESDTVPEATWAARQLAQYDLVDRHRNRPRARWYTIQTKQWTENHGRSYSTWWCGASDAFGVDAYVNSWGGPAYPDPKTWCQQMLDFAAHVDKPLVLPELGAVQRAGDTDDSGRAAWVQGVLDTLTAAGSCAMAGWWCAPGQNNRDFHLDHGSGVSPAEQTWKNNITKGKTT
jgi:hypothetical protein